MRLPTFFRRMRVLQSIHRYRFIEYERMKEYGEIN